MSKEIAINGEKRMTVKEVAEALGTAESTIRNKAAELFPEIIKNGIATMLNETQVVQIKQSIIPRDLTLKSKLDNAVTDIEMMEKTNQVMVWLASKIEQERSARIEAERKNAILMHVSKTYTATEIAKELNMRSAIELNKKLADMKIKFKQNDTWVLYADYANLGYTEIKQTVLDTGQVVYDRHFTQTGRRFILDTLSSLFE